MKQFGQSNNFFLLVTHDNLALCFQEIVSRANNFTPIHFNLNLHKGNKKTKNKNIYTCRRFANAGGGGAGESKNQKTTSHIKRNNTKNNRHCKPIREKDLLSVSDQAFFKKIMLDRRLPAKRKILHKQKKKKIEVLQAESSLPFLSLFLWSFPW